MERWRVDVLVTQTDKGWSFEIPGLGRRGRGQAATLRQVKATVTTVTALAADASSAAARPVLRIHAQHQLPLEREHHE